MIIDNFIEIKILPSNVKSTKIECIELNFE